MKKWWIILITLILLAVSVDAKCGDLFCDSNEDCESCPDDCLCTRGPHGTELIDCCNEFTCKECEQGYCKDRKCATLTGFTSMFQKASCSDNGSISLEVKFNELDSIILDPSKDLKVYMKKEVDESFKEITGTWVNPSREGEYRYTKIADTSMFDSKEGIFKLPGKHYVRVKYKIGRSNSIFEDVEVSCPGMPVEPVPIQVGEPEVEEVEPPKEEPEEEAEEEPAEQPVISLEEPQEESNLVWYIIIGVVLLGAIIFFIKYEIKILKKV